MVKFSYYITYINEGINNLKDYLLSDILFWELGLRKQPGEKPYPKLTIGNLLLFLKLAETSTKTPSESHQVTSVENQVLSTKQRWRTSWESKAEKEFVSRLHLWNRYLNDVRYSENDQESDYYKTEVRLRVILGLLETEINQESESAELLSQCDLILKARFRRGEFSWGNDLEDSFNDDKFWFLWGKISNI